MADMLSIDKTPGLAVEDIATWPIVEEDQGRGRRVLGSRGNTVLKILLKSLGFEGSETEWVASIGQAEISMAQGNGLKYRARPLRARYHFMHARPKIYPWHTFYYNSTTLISASSIL
jgi:hypothetical protein